jgi:hypothetical protein
MIKKVGTLLVVAMCIVCTVHIVIAQETPFVINGYVSYSNGTVCNNPDVNVMNTNTGESWPAENYSTSNCYRLVLTNGTDLNASETLKFEVTGPDGGQSKIVEFKVTQDEVNAGGRFGYNITLSVQGQQTWYFSTDTVTGPTWDGAAYNINMTKGMEGENDKVTLAKGERVWFYADQVAESNVSFPVGIWNVSYWVKATNSGDSTKQITTRLQGINSTGAKLSGSPYAQGQYNIGSPQNLEEVTESLNPTETFTIPEGGRFAIEVLWADGATGNLEIHCNPSGKHASDVTSPSSDPGYPIPELSTILLFGVGLLVIAGYVELRRKRRE